tara:strand:- start:5 stop:181 length:177 start_codon:yes stop_codon:yes gene_type:complete
MEFLRHSLGLCGEHAHPNIFTIILGGLGSTPIFSYIYYKFKSYGESQSRSANVPSREK